MTFADCAGLIVEVLGQLLAGGLSRSGQPLKGSLVVFVENVAGNERRLREVRLRRPGGVREILIVTGTEPRAPVLTEEPYWQHFVQLLSFAREHTVASIWSCLAAHGAVS